MDVNNALDISSIPPAKQSNKPDIHLHEVYKEWIRMLNVSRGDKRIEL
jgi:hypothetical protein